MVGEGSEHGRHPSRRRTPAETRQEILDAAWQFLTERPFRELTVARLMEGASVGRSSFYVHFHDLYGLAAALLHDLDVDLEHATRAGRQTPQFPASLPVTLGAVVDFWERNGPLIRAISEASGQDERLHELYRHGFTQGIIDRITGAIEGAQADGLVALELDAREVATLLALMDDRYLGDRLGGRRTGDTATIRQTLVMSWRRVLQDPPS